MEQGHCPLCLRWDYYKKCVQPYWEEKILKKGILYQFVAGCDRFKEGFVLAMKELVEAWSLPKKTVAIIIRYHVWQKPPPTESDWFVDFFPNSCPRAIFLKSSGICLVCGGFHIYILLHSFPPLLSSNNESHHSFHHPHPGDQVVSHLFSLLADLSKNSSVTQMDPYNIAICFAPNLCPIPEGYDQMQFTNQVKAFSSHLFTHL